MMEVDLATPDDAEAITAIRAMRPADPVGPSPDAVIFVARDAKGVAGFLQLRVDLDAKTIVAEQLEGEWADGPTTRGQRALLLLGGFLHRKARYYECKVVTVVNIANTRHVSALCNRGYHTSAYVLEWDPQANVSRPRMEAL